MKFAIFLFTILLCLLVGTLARPDVPIDGNELDLDHSLSGSPLEEGERDKRSAEEDSEGNSNGSGSYAVATNALKSISKRVYELLGQFRKIPAVKEITSSFPDIFTSGASLDQVAQRFSPKNVDKFLKQLNPLNEVLMNMPLVSDGYESALRVIATFLSAFANILVTFTSMFGKIIPTISSITPPLLR